MGRMRMRSLSMRAASDDLMSAEETGADVRTATAMLIDSLPRIVPSERLHRRSPETIALFKLPSTISAASALLHHEVRERCDIRHQENQNTHQTRQRDTVEEDVTQNVPLVSVPLGSGTGHDNALRVDHLAHDAATTVG